MIANIIRTVHEGKFSMRQTLVKLNKGLKLKEMPKT